jgi:hypothetical protein
MQTVSQVYECHRYNRSEVFAPLRISNRDSLPGPSRLLPARTEACSPEGFHQPVAFGPQRRSHLCGVPGMLGRQV